MTKREFQEFCENRIIYLDGATGSNLMKAGMNPGMCTEQWILKNRDVMLQLQREYVQAGTDILYCPTFTANRVKLREYGLEKQMESMIKELVGISAEAARMVQRKVLIAGNLTMTGEQLVPMGRMEQEELIDIYKEQIQCLVRAGVDLLVVETMMSLAEARAALIAAKEVCSLPVMVTMSFEENGRTLYGTDALTAAVCLESLGASAVGANCSVGPAHMREVIRSMSQAVSIPVIAKPNAGLPTADGDNGYVYDMDAEQFGEEMQLLAAEGAGILGGCCGTTPEYIKLLREKTGSRRAGQETTEPVMPGAGPTVGSQWADGYKEAGPTAWGNSRRKEPGKKLRYLTSERMTVSFALEDQFLIVGERINPTGKKALQEQLRRGCFEMVQQFAEEQEERGAQILDINMGMSGIDEREMMNKAIQEVACVSNLPLSLDSSHVEVLESALRRYPGRALVNSVSMEKEKLERLLPIVAKYGAMFILLPLSDKGLPENLEEKKQIINTIVDRALELGMSREDIIVDGLVTTVGANKRAALETLETIRYCREMGLATICGLSNISFGMPERGFVNTAFLTLAIQAGLTMAIANPSQEMLVSCALATDLLLNKEGADIRYIEYAADVKERREHQPMVCRAETERKQVPGEQNPESDGQSPESGGQNPESCRQSPEYCRQNPEPLSPVCQELFDAVLKGNRKSAADITRRALDRGEEAAALLNQVLLPAINQVGEYFDKGRYFLPQLIAGAETMKTAIEILEPLLLQSTDAENMPTAVIATVEGDIHDIGKNLVGLMLKNYGFQVIDLGKDVPGERIVREAKEHHAEIIGLSALMTTTMQKMREVVELAHKEGVTAKIMIGGAVITEEYKEAIGADGYAADAAGAVRVAKELLGVQ